MRSETELPYHRIGPKGDNSSNDNSNNGDSNVEDNDNSNSDEHQAESTTPPCPHCGKTDKVVPIIYGYPGEDLSRDQQAGKLRLGGCCVSEDGKDPQWYCKRDGEEF